MQTRWKTWMTVLLAAGTAAALGCASPPPEEPRVPQTRANPFDAYQGLPSPKALAAAFDGQRNAYGMMHAAPSVAAAETQALLNCEHYRERYRVEAPCTLRAVDDRVVWSLADALNEFDTYPGHKAFWVAGDPNGHDFGSTWAQPSQRDATDSAMADCRVRAKRFRLDFSCRICAVDDGLPCTQFEPGWEGP